MSKRLRFVESQTHNESKVSRSVAQAEIDGRSTAVAHPRAAPSASLPVHSGTAEAWT